MPLRAPKMYGFIFGFQRLVWCPKCTPASSSCFIVTSLMGALSYGLLRARLVDDHQDLKGNRACGGCEQTSIARTKTQAQHRGPRVGWAWPRRSRAGQVFIDSRNS